MSMNRAMRRKQVREQMHDWVRTGEMEKARRLSQNGITKKDLQESYDKGHEEGYKAGTDRTLKTVYAGILLELLDSGTEQSEAVRFLRNLDDRMVTSIDAGEDIEEVYKRTGIRLVLKEDLERVREV